MRLIATEMLLADVLHLNRYAAKLATETLLFLVSWTVQKYAVFAGKPQTRWRNEAANAQKGAYFTPGRFSAIVCPEGGRGRPKKRRLRRAERTKKRTRHESGGTAAVSDPGASG